MIILDTLSGDQSVGDPFPRWLALLKAHKIPENDVGILYALRCAVLHGYGLPRITHRNVGGRKVLLTDDLTAYAVDTRVKGRALVSVPVFCSRLVERIAAAVPDSWDVSEIDVNRQL